jgi:hypothetical protein
VDLEIFEVIGAYKKNLSTRCVDFKNLKGSDSARAKVLLEQKSKTFIFMFFILGKLLRLSLKRNCA